MKRSKKSSEYKLAYHPRVFRFLRRFPQREKRRILSKLEKLRTNPFSTHLNIKRLEGSPNRYRIRVGKMRIIYSFDAKSKLIYLEKAKSRGQVYKK